MSESPLLISSALVGGAPQPDELNIESLDMTNSIPSKFKCLTLNCWGVPISKHRQKRMIAIGKKLAESNFDIVALQEVWYDRDWNLIRAALREGKNNMLRHAHRFKSGAMGSGIVILSKYKIVDANFQCFNSSGKFYKFWHGDAYAGKGIAHAVLDTPIGLLDVYSTHTHASYDETRIIHEEYHGVRLAQMMQLAKYIRNTSKNALGIVMGDFNAVPDSIEMKLFLEISGFKDAFAEFQKSSGDQDNGYTCTLENVFNTGGIMTSLIFPSPSTIFPTRLDYIFYKFEPGKFLRSARVVHSSVTFNGDEVLVSNGVGVPFSDHFGVEAAISIQNSDTSEAKESTSLKTVSSESFVQLMTRSIEILDHSIKEAELRRRIFMVSKWILLILTCIFESLFFLFVEETILQKFIAIVIAIVMVTFFMVFLFLDKSMVPAEISALEQSRGELGLLWRLTSHGKLSISSDDAMKLPLSR